MVPPNLVKANVVNITKPGAPVPKQTVLDANVLYFIYYPNFSQLASAGGKPPQHYQITHYPAWLTKGLKGSSRFYAAPVTFGEFLRVIEYAEIEALWRTDPATPSGAEFSPRQCKMGRYSYVGRLGRIRQDAISFLLLARKTVDLLPEFRNAADELDKAVNEWNSSAGDFADATMVANAKYAMVPNILSDDIDLLTFDGITLYTANFTAIQDAAVGGKLIN